MEKGLNSELKEEQLCFCNQNTEDLQTGNFQINSGTELFSKEVNQIQYCLYSVCSLIVV